MRLLSLLPWLAYTKYILAGSAKPGNRLYIWFNKAILLYIAKLMPQHTSIKPGINHEALRMCWESKFR